MYSCVLFSLIVTSVLISISNQCISPIIFIPGSFCSLLEVRINTTIQTSCSTSFHNRWIRLWWNVRLFEPTHLACFQRIFQFVYDNATQSFVHPAGVETRPIIKSNNSTFLHGLLWEYIELDKFQNHLIRKYNYTDGRNLRSIVYDFRRGTQTMLLDFTTSLKGLVELTYADNSNTSLHLISHSTGGSMILFFLSQQTQLWKDRYIRRWISLSGNLAGEVDNLQYLIQGFLSPIVSRQVLQTWDFFAWRLPEPTTYGSQRIIVQTPSRNYTSVNMLDLLHDMHANDLAVIYPSSSLILASKPAPNVATYCFSGTNISTAIGYRSKFDQFDGKQLATIYGSGDGEQDDTTNMSCQQWNRTMDRIYPLIVKGFNRIHHTAMVSHRKVLDKIDKIILS
jgi:lysophospholipase III